jgi:hypothetical protein
MEAREFIEYLEKNPKYQKGGYVDEEGFYRQPDESNIK